MKVYISSSWKQRERVRAMARQLRAAGHEVYDFTDPASRSAILNEASEEIPPEAFPVLFDPALPISYGDYLERPVWRRAVEGNRRALNWCEVVLLLLPCGLDAHSDWALGVGLGKRSAVIGAPPAGERVPSHLWADARLASDEDVLNWLAADELAQATAKLRAAFDSVHGI